MVFMKGWLQVFTDILKIKPQLDNRDLNEMDKKLSQRFGKIAKGFGKGLKSAGLLALGGAVLERMLNPLQEVKAAIDRTLGKADDTVTNAKQFGTSTQNFVKLRAIGEMNGLAPEQLDTLLTKYQGAVAQFRANPNDESVSSVRNFAGNKDTAAGFLDFITSMQKMTADQRTLIQTQVFGEKQVLKMAEFLQANFQESADALKGIDFKKVAKDYETLGNMQDKYVQNAVIRNLQDISGKAAVINKGTLNDVNRSETSALMRENGQIARAGASFTVEENMNKIQENVEKLATQLLNSIPEVFDALNGIAGLLKKSIDGWVMIIDLIKKSPMMKGIGGVLKSLNPFGSDE